MRFTKRARRRMALVALASTRALCRRRLQCRQSRQQQQRRRRGRHHGITFLVDSADTTWRARRR